MKAIKIILLSALTAVCLTGCGTNKKAEVVPTPTAKATSTANTNGNNGTVANDAKNAGDAAGNVAKDAGNAVGDAAKGVGDAAKDITNP